jgi:large subunit ribosomal protein L23
MRDYMKRVYNVNVLRVRSYVEEQKVTRERRDGEGYGPLRRPKSKKRMTIEMTEPFVWPEAPKDLSLYVLCPLLGVVIFKITKREDCYMHT